MTALISESTLADFYARVFSLPPLKQDQHIMFFNRIIRFVLFRPRPVVYGGSHPQSLLFSLFSTAGVGERRATRSPAGVVRCVQQGSRLWVGMTGGRGWSGPGEGSALHRATPGPGDARDAVGRTVSQRPRGGSPRRASRSAGATPRLGAWGELRVGGREGQAGAGTVRSLGRWWELEPRRGRHPRASPPFARTAQSPTPRAPSLCPRGSVCFLFFERNTHVQISSLLRFSLIGLLSFG